MSLSDGLVKQWLILKNQTGDQRGGGSEWEPIKILLEGDGYSNKTNMANEITSPTQLPKLANTT
jgi:hypothetical protein